MNNKELILKRLLEDKHITFEEMLTLNEKEYLPKDNNVVVIKDLTNTQPYHLPTYPYCRKPIWQVFPDSLPTYFTTSDYKMD